MRDEVVKSLPEWFVDRMRRWAQFRLSSGAYSVPSSWPSDGPMPQAENRGSRSWFLLGSVHDTQIMLDGVPSRFRQAVQQFWILEGYGFSLRDHARRRGITHPTFALWLRKGHIAMRLACRDLARRRRAVLEAAGRPEDGDHAPAGVVVDKPNLPIYHSVHRVR